MAQMTQMTQMTQMKASDRIRQCDESLSLPFSCPAPARPAHRLNQSLR